MLCQIHKTLTSGDVIVAVLILGHIRTYFFCRVESLKARLKCCFNIYSMQTYVDTNVTVVAELL